MYSQSEKLDSDCSNSSVMFSIYFKRTLPPLELSTLSQEAIFFSEFVRLWTEVSAERENVCRRIESVAYKDAINKAMFNTILGILITKVAIVDLFMADVLMGNRLARSVASF